MNQQQNTVENVIFNRLAGEIGMLKTRVIQVETYNEVLVKQVNELQAELDKLQPKEVEQGEGEASESK